MYMHDVFILAMILMCFFFLAVLSLLIILLLILPLSYTGQLRHKLAEFVLWQWIKGSKVSAVVHEWLWASGNGKEE